MSHSSRGERLVTITDVDTDGVRRPVLATSDPAIVKAVERAVRKRLQRPPSDPSVVPPRPTCSHLVPA